MNRVEVESIFHLTDVVSHATQSVKVVECSAKDGTGLSNILQWIQQNARQTVLQ